MQNVALDDFDSVEEKAISWVPPPVLEIDSDSEGSVFSDSDDEAAPEDEDASNTSEFSESSSDDDKGAPDASPKLGGHKKALVATARSDNEPENKFLTALMNAALNYSSRLRLPSGSTKSAPTLSHMLQFEDDEDGDMAESNEGFSSDDDDDLAAEPPMDPDHAARLFYKPKGGWARFANEPIENPVVIAKLNAGAMCEASIKQGTIGGRKITYISKTWSLSQTWEGFFSEMALYAHPAYLRPLQGTVVPTIIGVYLVDGRISVAMELPSAAFWIEASEVMSVHLKRKCLAAFAAVHARGVLHNDVELRHMLVSAEGTVTLIDFQMSRALVPVTEVGLEAATENELQLEMRKVRFKLDYQDAQRKENDKRRRVYQRRARNARRRKERALNPGHTAQGDDESEPEDPDDILNPIVEPQIWSDCWLGDEPEASCYVVPGQDATKVEAKLRRFAMEEMERLEAEEKGERQVEEGSVQINVQEDASHSTSRQVSLSSQRGKPSRLQVIEDKGGSASTSFRGQPTSTMVSASAIAVTARHSLKRTRDRCEDSSDEENGAASQPPPFKRPYTGTELSTSSRPTFNISSPFAVPASSSVFPDFASLPPPRTPSRLPAVIHVPYEGYTGTDGFVLENTFSNKEVARMRRVWIMQDNVQRCTAESLLYPLATRFPPTDGSGPPSPSEAPAPGATGKKRKAKVLFNRGALKRAKLELDNPGKRKADAEKRKERYMRKRARANEEYVNSSEDENEEDVEGVEDGPRIFTWKELEAHKAEHSDVYSPSNIASTSAVPASALSAQPQSILRRKLSPEEKRRQLVYEEHLKLQNPKLGQVSSSDEEMPNVLPTPIAGRSRPPISAGTQSSIHSTTYRTAHGSASHLNSRPLAPALTRNSGASRAAQAQASGSGPLLSQAHGRPTGSALTMPAQPGNSNFSNSADSSKAPVSLAVMRGRRVVARNMALSLHPWTHPSRLLPSPSPSLSDSSMSDAQDREDRDVEAVEDLIHVDESEGLGGPRRFSFDKRKFLSVVESLCRWL